MAQVLAIEDLHFRRIIHRDLKPSNILLSAHDQVQVADFGLARRFGPSFNVTWRGDPDARLTIALGSPRSLHHSGAEKDFTMSWGGTWAYMSPEAIRGRAVSYPADVWGIGVCLYEMLLGKLPFDIKPASTKRQIAFLVVSTPVEFDRAVNLHPPAKDLTRKLLVKDSSTHIIIKQVKMHPWFESVDWDAVTKKCSTRRNLHWYAHEDDEPVNSEPPPSTLDVEFGTPYKTAQDVPYPWFQWTQPGPLTSPMDRPRFQEMFLQFDTNKCASSLYSHLNVVEVPIANTSTRYTYDASNRPLLSTLYEDSSVTLASNSNSAKKTSLATPGDLKAKGSWIRLTLGSK
ncbi:hypothetical protein V8D89_014831 [Ganoderma adspersum]